MSSKTMTDIAGPTIYGWLVIHAPKEIPGWFAPAMPPRPERPSLELDFSAGAGLNRDEQANAQRCADSWRRDTHWSLPDTMGYPEAALCAFTLYEEAWRTFWDEGQEWDREREKQRVAQWPWAYADLVLAAEAVQR